MADPTSSADSTDNSQQEANFSLDDRVSDSLEDLFGGQDLEEDMKKIEDNEDRLRNQEQLL